MAPALELSVLPRVRSSGAALPPHRASTVKPRARAKPHHIPSFPCPLWLPSRMNLTLSSHPKGFIVRRIPPSCGIETRLTLVGRSDTVLGTPAVTPCNFHWGRNRRSISILPPGVPSEKWPILGPSRPLLEKCHRLQSRYLKSLSASRILALDKVIGPQHVRPGLGEFRAVTFVSPGSQRLLLCPHNPSDVVRIGLMAKQTGKVGRLQHLLFFEKVTLVHKPHILTRKRR